jgi:hypothetical protein
MHLVTNFTIPMQARSVLPIATPDDEEQPHMLTPA